MLELLQNGIKRIPHIRHDTWHRIRRLAYFRMIHVSDLVCWESTRMDRRCFAIMCHILRTIAGLMLTKVDDVEELVAMFLHIFATWRKNSCDSKRIHVVGWDNFTSFQHGVVVYYSYFFLQLHNSTHRTYDLVIMLGYMYPNS